MRIDEPLWAGVVEVGQRAFLELRRRSFVTGDRALGIVGDRPVGPLDPFGRVEPAIA